MRRMSAAIQFTGASNPLNRPCTITKSFSATIVILNYRCGICEHEFFFRDIENALNDPRYCPVCGSKRRYERRRRASLSAVQQVHGDRKLTLFSSSNDSRTISIPCKRYLPKSLIDACVKFALRSALSDNMRAGEYRNAQVSFDYLADRFSGSRFLAWRHFASRQFAQPSKVDRRSRRHMGRLRRVARLFDLEGERTRRRFGSDRILRKHAVA